MTVLAWLKRRTALLGRRSPPVPVLIGHSHCRAVFEAAEAERFAVRGYNFWSAPQPAINDARSAFHPEIAQTLAAGPVFSMVGGALHNVLGMVSHPRRFDFVLPDRPDLAVASDAEVLPFAAMRETMASGLAEYLEIIDLVREAARGRVYHIEAPPPLEDSERVLADVPWTFFGDRIAEVAPAALRYKCWRLHSSLVDAHCEKAGIEVIRVPQQAITPRGYLEPAFYLDAMHVNARYGALVLEQIKQKL